MIQEERGKIQTSIENILQYGKFITGGYLSCPNTDMQCKTHFT